MPNGRNKNRRTRTNVQPSQTRAIRVRNTINRRARGPARPVPRRSPRIARKAAIIKHGLNAFHPLHVPLPMSTGKYTVIRTSAVFNSDSYLTLIGAMGYDQTGASAYNTPVWSNYCALSKANASDSLTSQWGVHTLPPPTGTDSSGLSECVPAAVSVQVVNPTSLNNAAGVVYMGRCATTLSQPGSSSADAGEFANALISYAQPKSISGATLAMKNQQINLVPANINELNDFRSIGPPSTDSGVTPTGLYWGDTLDFAGFKPAYIINPNKENLTYRLCIEWRVRLSPLNPMHMVQQAHPPTSHDAWHKIISTAESMGHGVEDVGLAGGAGLLMSGAGEGLMASAGEYAAGAAAAMLPALEAAAPLLLL